MRIQHNIMAMNAYRNYNTNTSALSKNLEKLSSGYKINRAGDDAAGLAISEKMRAQITGLNAAQKNVKDGISLVKTAEGAMQEIQDMLNRMDYLATQSANGTYDNEVDRANLNKEMDALKTEIDRIADSANFNGTKLMDGSLDSDAATRAQEAVDKAQAKLDAANATQVQGKDTAKTAAEVLGMLPGVDPNNDPANVATATITETESGTVATPSFKVSLDGVSHVIADKTDATTKLGLTINGQKFEISEKDIADEFTTLKNGDKVTGEQLAKVFAKKMMGSNQNVAVGTGADAKKWIVKAADKSIEFTYDTAQTGGNGAITDKINLHYNVKLDGIASGTPVDAKKAEATSGATSFNGGTLTAEAIAVTVAYKKADGTTDTKDISYTITADDVTANMTADQLSAKLAEAMNNDADLKGLFTATYDTGSHKFKLEANTAGAGKGQVTDITVKTTGASKYEIGAINAADVKAGENAYTPGTTGYVNAGTEVVVTASPSKPDQLASTVIDLSQMLADGTKVTLGKGTTGEMTYIIAKGPNSAYINETGAKIKVVKVDENADAAAMASALSEAAKDNTIFSVSHTGTDGKIGLKQLEAVKDSTDMTTREKIAGYIGISTVSAADAQAKKDAAVAAAQAELDKATAAKDALKDGKELILQIGDTSDKFNQMGVKIGDMHVNAMGTGTSTVDGVEVQVTKTIKDIDIKSPETAHEAINVIKNAINYVSGIRGDLGAVQNRLEHTANNLSVMAENIQDAESTIRDTDVAEEMMAYTKNNILIQSAQAMLAQANAVPQGVLQLLG